MRTLILLLSLGSALFALDAKAIIDALDKNFRGDRVYMKLTMRVESRRGERMVRMESWAKGDDKSFIKTLYPKKDRGITFLKIDNELWQYIPKIERTIKIPSSMMLQSWMGSDFTNDDMVKESSLVDDYDASLLKLEGNVATVKLVPHEDAAVVWGRIVARIDVNLSVPLEETYYDDNGEAVRTMTYSDVRRAGTHNLPRHWELKPLDADKQGNRTVIDVDEVDYDSPISDDYFTKQALRRYSR